MNGDIFESQQIKNADIKKNISNNFFLQKDAEINRQSYISESNKHINDYDSNILKEDAYKEINDDSLKTEYKIQKTKEYIEELNARIQAAKDIRDFNLAEILTGKRKQAQLELNNLSEIYNNSSLSAKLSNSITTNFINKLNAGKETFNKAGETILSFLPSKLSTFVEIKRSLNKLENINKNVNELMLMNIPYGESAEKYEQLSKYIAKANFIQAEISKALKH